MQSLSAAIKERQANSETSINVCARHVLDVTPPVVREIRGQMRSHRLAGLSVPQFRALALLSFSPKASLSQLADYVGTSLPAASRMVDGLVERKLVHRCECSDDRRQISLALTPRGQVAFRQSRRRAQQHLAHKLNELSQEQRRSVIAAMNLLAGVFGTDAEGVRRGNGKLAGPRH